MSRRQARELALQALFQLDFNSDAETIASREAQEKAIEAAVAELEHGNITARDRGFIEKLVFGTMTFREDIDAMINGAAKDWKVSRMAGVDRNIARMAVYELKFDEEKTDVGVVVNEAIELAKKYGTDESSRFINGVLAGVNSKG